MTATRQSMASFYVVSVSQPQLICRIQNTTIHFLAYLYYYPFNAGLSCLLVLFSLSKISLKRDLRNKPLEKHDVGTWTVNLYYPFSACLSNPCLFQTHWFLAKKLTLPKPNLRVLTYMRGLILNLLDRRYVWSSRDSHPGLS